MPTVPATSPAPPPTAPSVRVGLALAAWAAVAGALAASGALARWPPLVPLSIIGALVVAVVVHRRSSRARAALEALDVRWLLAAHVVRAPIGALFLVEEAGGHLPASFAQRGGWGDLLAGAGALALLLTAGRAGRAWRRAARWWNLLGTLDLLVVVATAQWLILRERDPLMIDAITRMPYPLLPTLVVPLMLALHLALWHRLRGPQARSAR